MGRFRANRQGGFALLMAATLGAGWPALASSADPRSPALIEAGTPWTPGDYLTAIFTVHNGGMTLPRRGNPKTEATFERLIDRGNVEALLAAPLSVEEKRRDILIILSATGEFRGRYGYAVALGDNVTNELIQLQIFRLYLIDRLTTLKVTAVATGCFADQQGCTGAVATALFGTLDTLSETQSFTQDQLMPLARAFAAHYPAISPALGLEERAIITGRLGKMAGAADPDLRVVLEIILREARRGN